jgi:eukaryotic-like serine/threonine-protein kinase
LPIPPSLRSREPIPAALEEIVLRCLAKRPTERFQSSRELLAALEACAPSPAWTPEDAKNFWTTRATVPRGEPPPPDPGPTVRMRPDKAAPVA